MIFATIPAYTQIDKILKPVEINPPMPGGPPQQKQQSDEQLASQYYRNREFDKAVILYEKLYHNKSTTIYYTYYLFCLLEHERFQDAEKLAKAQIKKYPDRLKYYVDLGYVYNEKEEESKAKKQFDLAIKKIVPNKSGIIELSNAFLYRGQTEYAVEVYRKGSKIMNYPFYLELGNLYRQTRNFSEMIESYLEAVDFDQIHMNTVQGRLQNVLKDDPEKQISEYLRVSLLTRIQKNPNKLYFSEMLLWLSIQNEDFEMALMQAKSIDRRNQEDGQRLFELSEISLSNKNYDIAIDAYKYILKKGKNNMLYIDAKVGLLYAHYLKVTETFDYTESDLLELENEYISTLDEYGKNSSTILIMQYLGHLQAFFLEKTSEAIQVLNEAIQMPNTSARNIAGCKIELADVYLKTGDVWEAKLLYAQVEKAFKLDPLGYEAKFKNAKLSFYIGEYDWAKAQLDVLKAATSKLIANDALRLSVLISDNMDSDSSGIALGLYAQADLYLYQNNEAKALENLDSIFTLASWHPIFDEVLMKKAEIMIRQRKVDEAVVYLEDVVENYGYDITADNALYQLGFIFEKHYNNEEKAMEYYQQLMTDYPGSLYVVDARKRFRYLRGDLNSEEMPQEELFFYDIKLPEN